MTDSQDNALLSEIHAFLVTQAQSGDKMDTETKLAKRFRVSRYRVRLVLDKLTQMGILSRVQKRGMTLDKVSPEKLADNFSTQLTLSGIELREFLEARIALADEMASLIVIRVTSASLETLQDLLSQMQGAEEVKPAAFLLHREFLKALYAASGNRVLEAYALALEKSWQGFIGEAGNIKARMPETLVDADKEILKALRICDARGLAEVLGRALREEMLPLIEH